MKIKEKLQSYVKLVDAAILINNKNEFYDYCDTYYLTYGVCWFIADFSDIKYVKNKGFRIIKRKYSNNFKNIISEDKRYWFETVNYISIELDKETLLARQQVVKDILEIYYPNSFKQLILNLWKRF